VDPAIIAAVALASCALVALATCLRVIAEYERGVVLRLGRRGPLLEPGLRLLLPLRIDRLIRVDLRSSVLQIPLAEVITRDGVPVRVAASAHLQVLNPLLAVTRVADYQLSTRELVQAAIRDVAARTDLRALLVDQAGVRDAIGRFVDPRAEPWGIRITAVDLRQLELPPAMQRAMERQAEILRNQQEQRERADAEVEAARRLAAAAEVLQTQPYAIQLRFLETLAELGAGNTNVIVLPLPMELLQPFLDLQGHLASAANAAGETSPPAGARKPDPGSSERTIKGTAQSPARDRKPRSGS
jgi:regulator of protease activity HflC (stomatin/prohibitin superfamily)